MNRRNIDSSILVTGGAGYIGSHVVRALRLRGAQVVVIDDLSQGFADALPPDVPLVRGGIENATIVSDVLRDWKVDAVMHFASRIQVGESLTKPAQYFQTNIAASIVLLSEVARAGVGKFIFSSTAAIFGQPAGGAIGTAHRQRPINPYGRSKWVVEQLLPDFEVAYGLRSVCLRYFNAAGAHPDGTIGERHVPETHLIPLAVEAALGRGPSLKMFGDDYPTPDGTCIRDYIHVMDLADAHLRALDYLSAGGPSSSFNLGNGSGYSVRQVIDTVAAAVGRSVPYEVVGRRAGDPAILVADASEAADVLGWRPETPALQDIVADAVRFHLRAR